MHFFRIIAEFFRDSNYRELMLISSIAVGIGTVVFHHLEEWSWIDSLYFSVITLTTVGYGDFSPQTDFGKLFAIVYIIVGVGIILNFIQVAYEHFQNKRKEDRGQFLKRPKK